MRKIISLICFLLPALSFAAQPQTSPQLRSGAPDRYVVVKGDTLWHIAGKFFNDPWKWPYIWGMNKGTIKNPHWIYPGNVIVLNRAAGTLGVEAGEVKLEPQVRESRSEHEVIPSIPADVIAPFLSRPLVVDENAMKNAPTLVGAREGRIALGSGDTAFAKGLPSEKETFWQIYRPGKSLVDPDTKEVLGIEAVYLGNAEVTKFADVSTIAITRSVEEITPGDRLVLPSGETTNNYLPRAPATNIVARVISIYGGVSMAGQNTIIVLNKGARDGLENGHVLALYHKGEVVKNEGKDITLPDERFGLAFVFRVFNKVSYALVMETRLPVEVLDLAETP